MVTLQFKRGPEASIPNLSSGEPGVTTDTEKLFVGMPSGNTEMAKQTDLSALSDTVTEINESYISNSQINVPGGVAGLGENGALAIAQGGTGANNSNDARQNLGAAPGRNLIRNWYFVGNGIPGQFPVNRNGRTNYSGNGISIDGWTLSNDSDLTLQSVNIKIWGTGDPPGGGNRVALYQTIPGDFDNQEVTLSVLVNGAAGSWYCQTNMGGQTSVITGPAGGPQLYSSTFTVQQQAELQVQIVKSSLSVNDYIEIIAIKLEFGPVQTLARQDESGDWILNDTPDYAEQYTICEQYSPIDGSFVGSQHSNPNLLDNWYFVGGGSQQGGGQFPINQRGKTSYTGAGYGIDRWLLNSDDTLTVSTTGVTITLGGNDYVMQQLFESPIPSGEVVTVSVLFGDGFLAYASGAVENTISTPIHSNFVFQIEATGDKVSFVSHMQNSSIEIIAAKLELGPVQTLAHQDAEGNWVLNDPPPNFQQELAKCQRYSATISKYTKMIGRTSTSVETNAQSFFNVNTTLRVLPSLESGASVAGNYRLYTESKEFIPTSVVVSYLCSTGVILSFQIPSGAGLSKVCQIEYVGDEIGLLSSNL